MEDTAPPIGPGPHASRLLVFLRRQAQGSGPRRLPGEPVAIHDVEGRELCAITRHNAAFDHGAGRVAYSCRATPGTYRLRATRSRRDAAIVVPAGRTALVFADDTGAVRLADLRQALVPIGERFDPQSPIWSAMESVIAALRTPDRTLPLAARVLLPDAAEQDLCFGIAAAHVLWRAGDRVALAAVMRRLERHRELPDVAILARLTGGAPDARGHHPPGPPAELADTPPVLRASLTLAMTRPELDAGTLSAYSATAHAARSGLPDSVWCVWSPRAWDERWIEPAVERLRSRARSRDRSCDVSAIARSLALAPETVEQALQAIESAAPGATGDPPGLPRIPGYTLAAVALGRGPRSTVYRATRRTDPHEVALKIVPVEGGADGCARALEALDRCAPTDHPQLLSATARGALPDASGIWLEMERCDGSALDLLSDEDAPLPPAEARRLVLEALGGLAQLHAAGIVHGDIKPANLLVRGDRSAALAGPGLAVRRALPDRSRHASDHPRFVPIELLRGSEPPSPAADVWAMAATYYFLLTLEFPREEYADQSQLEAALDNPVVSLARHRPDLPPALIHLIDTALSPTAEARPPDAGAFRDRLAAIEAAPARKPALAAGHAPRLRRSIALAAAAATIVTLLAWWVAARTRDARALVDDAMLRSRAASRRPDFAAALQAADEAVDLARRLPDRHAEIAALSVRAEVLRGVGDLHEAQRALTTASDLASDPCEQGWTRWQSSLCFVEAGQDALAMAQLGEAARANATCGDRNLADSVALTEAWLLRRPDPAAAGARLRALSSSAREQPQALLLGGYLAADAGDLEGAVRALDRVDPDSATASDWAWAAAWARAEIAEQRHGVIADVLGDVLAEIHYRRATALIAALRATARTRSAYLLDRRRGPYDGLIALLARQERWRDALAVVRQLDASDMLRSAADHGAVAPPEVALDDVLSAWRARDLVVVIAPSPRRIGPGPERAYRLRIRDREVTGEDIGDAGVVRRLGEQLAGQPGDAAAARSLGSRMIPWSCDTSTLYVLAVGALGKTPLPALRDATGSLVIARRPLVRVTALAALTPGSRGTGGAVILTGPPGTYPGAASEAATAARAAASDAQVAATRAQLWAARDAALLHVSAPTAVRGPWRALALADGEVEPPELIRRGLAPRLAVISGNSSATAMDEEGWGSLASALLESGTELVIATDRSVEDQSSLALMTAFYAQQDWATDPARALARAQVALVAQGGAATPWSTWAAFGARARPPVILRGSAGPDHLLLTGVNCWFLTPPGCTVLENTCE